MNTLKYTFIFLLVGCLTQACTMTKRVHSRGWHVEWKAGWKQQSRAVSTDQKEIPATAVRPEESVSVSPDSIPDEILSPQKKTVAEALPLVIHKVPESSGIAKVASGSEEVSRQRSVEKRTEKCMFPRPVKSEDSTPAYSLSLKIGRMLLILVCSTLTFLILIGIIAILDFAFLLSAATASFLFILAFVLVFLPTLYYSFHTFDHAVSRFGSDEARNRAYWLYALLALVAPVGLMILLAARDPKRTVFGFLD